MESSVVWKSGIGATGAPDMAVTPRLGFESPTTSNYVCAKLANRGPPMKREQTNLLDANPMPAGFRYAPELIDVVEEARLVERFAELPFKKFEFHGFIGKRRVVWYGWRYDFNAGGLQQADPLPAFLLPLRDRAASFAGLSPDQLQHVLITEYRPTASIGWHRDRANFEDVVGISLLSPCRFRMRRKAGEKWDRVSLQLERRSAYLMRGPSRDHWEHSIPAITALRYSVTFRSLRN